MYFPCMGSVSSLSSLTEGFSESMDTVNRGQKFAHFCQERIDLAGLFLEILWDRMTIVQAIYSTGEQYVNVIRNFSQNLA